MSDLADRLGCGRPGTYTAYRLLLCSFVGTVIAAVTLLLWAMNAPGFSPMFRVLLVADLPLAGLVLLALAAAALMRRWSDRLMGGGAVWTGNHPWAISTAVLVLLGVGGRLIYQAHPFSMDEYAVWFQSQIFAAGDVTTRVPVQWLDRLVPRFFQNQFLLVSRSTGEIASAYWPGFALLMTPFARAGVSWLCNPVLSALSLAALAVTARRLAPERPEVGGWAMLLTVASPAFVVLGLSFYAMTALMLTNLVFTWGFLSGRPRHLFWSGMVGGLALCMHNPLPHLLFALPWIVWLLWTRGVRRELLALAAGYLPLSALLGAGWLLVRARLYSANDVVAHGGASGNLGTIAQGLAAVLQVPDALVLSMRVAGLVKLWLWAVPGLLVLAAWGAWRHRESPFVTLFAASALLTFFGYFLVPFDQGHGWGYRYFHSAWAALPLLAALAVTSEREPGRSIHRLSAALVTVSLLVLVPAQLYLVRSVIGQQLALLPAEATATGGPRRLTIIDPRLGFYAQDLVQNDPFLRSGLRMIGDVDDTAFVASEFPGASIEARGPAAVVWRLLEPAPGAAQASGSRDGAVTLSPPR